MGCTAASQHMRPARRTSRAIQQQKLTQLRRVAGKVQAITTASGDKRQDKLHIAVLGAGIAGITSALRLHQKYPTAQITVVAHKFGADTTTHGAAGIWGPYKLGITDETVIHRISNETHEYLVDLYFSAHGPHAGISMSSGSVLFEKPEEDPFWKDIVFDFHRLTSKELSLYDSKYVDGYFYSTVTCEGRMYIPWAMKQLQAGGVRIVQQRVSSLQELISSCGQTVDLVVNCCGVEADELVGDKETFPIRGQIAKVRAPWVHNFLFADPYYIIPNQGYIVLGGTGQVGDYNRQVSIEDRAAILEGTRKLMPCLEAAEHLEDWVGLRPGRTGLRLEMEELGLGRAGEALPVIHNYGHGGSGLTLGWGCAGDVVKMAEEALG